MHYIAGVGKAFLNSEIIWMHSDFIIKYIYILQAMTNCFISLFELTVYNWDIQSVNVYSNVAVLQARKMFNFKYFMHIVWKLVSFWCFCTNSSTLFSAKSPNDNGLFLVFRHFQFSFIFDMYNWNLHIQFTTRVLQRPASGRRTFTRNVRAYFKNSSVGGGGASTKRDHTIPSVEKW
jgi:hypothetical protein